VPGHEGGTGEDLAEGAVEQVVGEHGAGATEHDHLGILGSVDEVHALEVVRDVATGEEPARSTGMLGPEVHGGGDGGRDDLADLARDAGTVFTYDLLDRTFRQVLAGAAFVAMHRNLTWKVSDGLALDSGAFVLGIEAASGVSPVVIGKPSAAFFAAATTELGTPTDRTVMVGDDLEADVRGAQTAGLRGVLVRTGKFRPSDLERPGPTPDAVIGSVAELPAWLGIAGPAT
jgi:ribonucleotide monophosphatase NagD (HAD superfamily)